MSPDKLKIVRPENLEHTFEMICSLLKEVNPEVLVVDSVAALLPKDILNADMTKQDFRGLSPRKIGVGIQKITYFNRSTAVILINQMRMDLGRTFGNPEKLPGGKALKHHNSMGIRVRRGKWLTDVAQDDGELFGTLADEKDAKRIGFLLRVRVEKNKRGAPWGECDIKTFFDGTIDPLGSLISLAIQRGVIEVAGRGWFLLPDSEQKLHGLPAVEKALKEDDEMKQKIIQLVKENK
ncbi:MAG TPA: hypothetical protein ENI23_04160 [bacterium]|nr:hypothetical protein [bacterium]